MSKRLILVLALALVVGITASAYAEVQNVKVSGDITAYGIGRNLTLRDSKAKSVAGAAQSAGWDKSLASIARVRIDADLTDNVMATVRLLNERYWGREAGGNETVAASSVNSDISLDLAYVTLKEFLYSPLTVTVGRQELHFGNEMVVGDPDTNASVTTASAFGANRADHDLSARKAFDAVRLTLNYDPLVIDGIYSKVRENITSNNDDQDLYGINLNYALNKKYTVEAYWFEKKTGNATVANASPSPAKNDRVDTVGARLAAKPVEDLMISLEGAYQFGKYFTAVTSPVVNRSAYAWEAGANYTMSKCKYTPSITVLSAFFSGEGNHFQTNGELTGKHRTYHAWDSMFENQKYGDIANALFPQSNVVLVGGIASMKPMDDVTLSGEYYAYWWNKRYAGGADADSIVTMRDTGAALVTTDKRQAGQELDVKATYDYTEDVQLGLMYGILWPGKAFDNANRNTASEVIGSMKVTF